MAPLALEVRDGRSGAPLTRADYAPAASRFGAPFLVVHRADLQNLLAEAAREAGCAIALGADLTSVEPAFGSVRAVVNQGGDLIAHGADILVGPMACARRCGPIMGAMAAPVFAHRVAYRATVNLPAGYPSEVRLYLGRNAHLVCYPVKGGTTLNSSPSSTSPAGGALERAGRQRRGARGIRRLGPRGPRAVEERPVLPVLGPLRYRPAAALARAG